MSAKAILRAFCDAFTDCSLWNGSGTHLMMVGTRRAAGPVSEHEFARQWQDARVAAEMRQLGFERPEQLGALFIGDAGYLRRLIGPSPALTDDTPKLIEAPFSSSEAQQGLIRDVTDTAAAKARFEASPLIARLWPEPLRKTSLAYFEFQDAINRHMYGSLLAGPSSAIDEVHRILTRSSLTAPVLWRLGSNSDIQNVVARATPEQQTDSLLQFHVGIRLISERKYGEAIVPLRPRAGADQSSIDAGRGVECRQCVCLANLRPLHVGTDRRGAGTYARRVDAVASGSRCLGRAPAAVLDVDEGHIWRRSAAITGPAVTCANRSYTGAAIHPDCPRKVARRA